MTASQPDEATNEPYDAFVHYSRVDARWVGSELLELLDQAGVRFFTLEVPYSGGDYMTEFERSASQSRYYLPVVSQRFLEDEWTQWAVKTAQLHVDTHPTGGIIPIRREDVELPPGLADWQGIDAASAQVWEKGREELVAALARSAEPPAEATETTVDIDETAQVPRRATKQPTPSGWPEFSNTVDGVAKDIGEDAVVSAFEIANAVIARHREYAQGSVTELAAPAGAKRYPWDIWRDSVARLYAEDAVRDSTHQVIDGRLLLAGIGLLDPDVKTALVDGELWAPLLLEIDETSTVGTPVQTELERLQLAHGYQSDRATGTDQLGIRGEVNALCEVITDRDVFPPLAIGLFGEWGSGKTFFMDKMRERIHESAVSDTAGSGLDVVQIRFNAWHYADTSLWASLAVEIFDRLADPEPVPEQERRAWLEAKGDPHRERRKAVLRQLETYREAKEQLDADQERLRGERDKLDQQLTEATEARKKDLDDFKLTDVAAELASDPDVTDAVKRVTDELGLTPAVTELSVVAAELRTTSGYVANVWRLTKNKTWTLTLLAAFAVLAVATAALLAAAGPRSLGGIGTAVASIASFVVAVSRYLRPAARKVNNALGWLEATIVTAEQVEARLRAKRSHQERVLEVMLADRNRQIAEVQQNIAALDEKIATAAAEADSLTVGRRLYEFLTDRAAGYQKHQGVVGMLHRDFRLLDAQLRAQPATPSGDELPHIDRVVLYVDDLDRCPPDKVLEVLEAVHLLLALELFIVVVGVDPRWLLRSLRHQYRALVTGRSSDPYLQTMPTEYLEKIFQVPLTLPAMSDQGFSQLIGSLAPSVDISPAPTRPTPSGTTRRATSDVEAGGDRAPTRALLEVQAGSAASGVPGQAIGLTPDEVRFAQQLGGLVDTPRAAKRLMNTYRLIRATRHVGSRSKFLGTGTKHGEFYAVLSLLAIAAGFPTQADRLLVALEDADDDGTWPDFVTELADTPITGPSADQAAWENLTTGLDNTLAANTLTSLEPYRRWGPITARFSFTV